MTTTVTTHNPVRSDVPETAEPATAPTRSRSWAFAGVGASVALAATIVTSTMVDVIYSEEYFTSNDGVAAALESKVGVLFAFHTVAMLSAVLLLVFAAGLHRRLRDVAPDSIAPLLAFGGLAGTSVVAVMGAGLDTEFMMSLGVGNEEILVSDSAAAMYNHWVGTIPWLWVLAGLAGLALFSVSRQGGVPRWMGRTGLVLGGLTVLAGVSPFEYMAGPIFFLMLLPVSLGLAFGDKAYQARLAGAR